MRSYARVCRNGPCGAVTYIAVSDIEVVDFCVLIELIGLLPGTLYVPYHYVVSVYGTMCVKVPAYKGGSENLKIS